MGTAFNLAATRCLGLCVYVCLRVFRLGNKHYVRARGGGVGEGGGRACMFKSGTEAQNSRVRRSQAQKKRGRWRRAGWEACTPDG